MTNVFILQNLTVILFDSCGMYYTVLGIVFALNINRISKVTKNVKEIGCKEVRVK